MGSNECFEYFKQNGQGENLKVVVYERLGDFVFWELGYVCI